MEKVDPRDWWVKENPRWFPILGRLALDPSVKPCNECGVRPGVFESEADDYSRLQSLKPRHDSDKRMPERLAEKEACSVDAASSRAADASQASSGFSGTGRQ